MSLTKQAEASEPRHESPGINDDPMIAEREQYLAAQPDPPAPGPERMVAWSTPKGEDATGYNAGVYQQVYDDVIGPAERERLNKLENSSLRKKNYAKESTWQSQLVNSLVKRIMNLRLMLLAASSPTT